MFLILVLALLVYSVVRWIQFSRLAFRIQTEELRKAQAFSIMAVTGYVVFLLLSAFARFRLSPQSEAVAFSIGFWLVGLVVACVFDIKAEKLKRKAEAPKDSGNSLAKTNSGPQNYQVEYKNQNWAASFIEAPSALEAAKRYLQRDSEKRWRNYDEIIVISGFFGKQRESFVVQDLLAPSGSQGQEAAIPTAKE